MYKIEQLDFSGQTTFCGIDAHKKSWQVNMHGDQFESEDYSQDLIEELLWKHLQKRYPGVSYQATYESGFGGFGIQPNWKF